MCDLLKDKPKGDSQSDACAMTRDANKSAAAYDILETYV